MSTNYLTINPFIKFNITILIWLLCNFWNITGTLLYNCSSKNNDSITLISILPIMLYLYKRTRNACNHAYYYLNYINIIFIINITIDFILSALNITLYYAKNWLSQRNYNHYYVNYYTISPLHINHTYKTLIFAFKFICLSIKTHSPNITQLELWISIQQSLYNSLILEWSITKYIHNYKISNS